jgi:hypothetical protein
MGICSFMKRDRQSVYGTTAKPTILPSLSSLARNTDEATPWSESKEAVPQITIRSSLPLSESCQCHSLNKAISNEFKHIDTSVLNE